MFELLNAVGLQLVVLFQLRNQFLVIGIGVNHAHHNRRDRADDGADNGFPHRLHLQTCCKQLTSCPRSETHALNVSAADNPYIKKLFAYFAGGAALDMAPCHVGG